MSPVRGQRGGTGLGVSCAAAIGLALSPGLVRADTLLDAVRLAYATNPTFREDQAQLRAIDEGYVQARAALGPQVNLTGQYGYENALVQQPSSIFAAASTSTFQAGTGSADLSLTQPLYTGGKVDAAVRGASASILAGRDSLRQAEGQLLVSVVTAYTDVRTARAEVDTLVDEIKDLRSEADEIKARGALGQVSKTDVAEAEARLLSAQAELDTARGRLNSSNAEYLNVVGESPGQLDPAPEFTEIPNSVDDAFEAAEHNNPELQSAIESERAAHEAIAQAKAASHPNVSVRLDSAIAPVEPYLPEQYQRSLSASLVVNQSIFTSGQNSSQVREAADRDSSAELQIEVTRRNVVQSVAQAWDQLMSTRDAITIEQRQIDLEKISVEGNRVEERVGLRTTIDMLNAELEFANAKLSLLQSQHDEYVAGATLLSTMGLLQAKFITPDIEQYNPVASFERVKQRDAAPWEDAIDSIDSLGNDGRHAPPPSPDAGSDRPNNLPPASPSKPQVGP